MRNEKNREDVQNLRILSTKKQLPIPHRFYRLPPIASVCEKHRESLSPLSTFFILLCTRKKRRDCSEAAV